MGYFSTAYKKEREKEREKDREKDREKEREIEKLMNNNTYNNSNNNYDSNYDISSYSSIDNNDKDSNTIIRDSNTNIGSSSNNNNNNNNFHNNNNSNNNNYGNDDWKNKNNNISNKNNNIVSNDNSSGSSSVSSSVSSSGKKYLLKRLYKSSVFKQNNVKAVLDEGKILESINSLFILNLLGKFQTTDELIFVFECVHIGDLWYVIHENSNVRDLDGFLSIDVLRFYTANILLALEHLHYRKIAYRNLKPENILVDANGYIKITSMSFAKVRNTSHPTGSLYMYTSQILLYDSHDISMFAHVSKYR